MHNPCDVHSLSRLCREDALREARERHLVWQAGDGRGRRFGRNRAGVACKKALLALFGRTKPAEAR
jgi:hypothetical protein